MAIGISQPFETGEQQARAPRAAAAGLDALRAEIDDVRRQARVEAATRFLAVRCRHSGVQLEQRSVDLFERSARRSPSRAAARHAARRQRKAGRGRTGAQCAGAGGRALDRGPQRTRHRGSPATFGVAWRLPVNSAPKLTTPCRTSWSSCSHRRRTCPGSALLCSTRRRRPCPARRRAWQPQPRCHDWCARRPRGSERRQRNAWRSFRCRCRCPCSNETTPPSARR
ncbi:MAG: TolC family protein [Comamonadaceae bacterium]|nr:TolC family protein [Comamonadaceae bacterium]